MEEPQPTPDPNLVREKAEKLVSEAPRRWMEATVTILVIVGLFAFIGKSLDNWLSTTPWLFISGIVVAFPVSQYLIYRQLKKRFKL